MGTSLFLPCLCANPPTWTTLYRIDYVLIENLYTNYLFTYFIYLLFDHNE